LDEQKGQCIWIVIYRHACGLELSRPADQHATPVLAEGGGGEQ
jgi:hypothetical protein